jgi:hypothetical protein
MIPLLLTNKQNSNIKVLNENNHAGYRMGTLYDKTSPADIRRKIKGNRNEGK